MREFKKRFPVIYKGKPLMPMRIGRVQKYIKLGYGKIEYHSKLGILYFKLTKLPSSFNTQNIYLFQK